VSSVCVLVCVCVLLSVERLLNFQRANAKATSAAMSSSIINFGFYQRVSNAHTHVMTGELVG